MDLLLLWMVGEISRKSFRVLRLLGSAGVGAAWACFWVLCPNGSGILFEIGSFLILAFLMIKIAFPITDKKEWIRMVLLWYLAACLTGGAAEILLSRWGTHIWTLVFLAAGLVCIIKAIVLPLMKGEAEKQRLYDVELVKSGSVISMRALLDTGNRLYEPYGGNPVCVISESSVAEEMKKTAGILYVPYQSIGTKQGFLPAIKFDEIRINEKKRKIRVEKPVIAFYHGEVSADGSYKMLLHKDLLKK